VTYFTNNAERMKHAQYRAAGYLIGSGKVESGCKQIVTQRFKQLGANGWLKGLCPPPMLVRLGSAANGIVCVHGGRLCR
jgi:hypothetical protein